VNFKLWISEWEGNNPATGETPTSSTSFGSNPKGWPVRSKLNGPGTLDNDRLAREPDEMYGLKPRPIFIKKQQKKG
jgi:hypothetical protein